MARILEFTPRGPRFQEPLSPEQYKDVLQRRTLDTIRELVQYYRSTGHWTQECEPHTIHAIEALQVICDMLTTGEYHAKQPQSLG